MKINKKISYILSGILALSGVNIPSSIAESNTKEVNQIDEKYVVASYPNILNLDSDVMALYKENEKNYFYTFEKCFWICLKINGKNTLFLTYFNSLIYDYSSNPTIVPGKMWDVRDHNEQYFAEKKQIIENIIKYSDLYNHKKNILFEGDSIMDLFNHTKLIGILVKTQGKSLFFHNTNFFNNKEEVELTFITNNLNELANLISVDLDKCDLPERVKEYMKDSSIELSAMDLYNLYMAIVPDEYLPTLTQKQLNINPSLPIFKDEILKKEIDKQKAKMGIKYFETGSGKSKYLAFYLDHKTKAYYDFFTREKIVNYDGTDFNEEYRKKIDYVNKNDYEELWFLENSIHTSDISLMKYDYYFPELRYLFTYMSTYGDFVDFYQKIPLDQQIDYSFYDFSKSPIIDQYEELPKPASCIPYIDYENNTLYAIPKTGRDNDIIKQLLKNKENS